jgi:hypothetical protein
MKDCIASAEDPARSEPHSPICVHPCLSLFLICVKFLCQTKRQWRLTYDKNFNADKKRDARGFTQMLSDHVPIRGIPMGSQFPWFSTRCFRTDTEAA